MRMSSVDRGSTCGLLSAILVGLCSAGEPAEPVGDGALMEIANGGAVLAVAPAAGGRVVAYRLAGGANVLKASSRPPGAAIPEPAVTNAWFDVSGHQTWVGPQNDWWQAQDLAPKRRAERATWPPDPWLECGRFHVREHQPARVRLEGPVSPVTGLQLVKTLSLAADGSATVRVTARNCRTVPVAWELWSNTRLEGRCRCYLALDGSAVRVEVKFWEPVNERLLEFATVNGFFTFTRPATLPPPRTLIGKAFLAPRTGRICAFGKDFLFVKSFAVTPAAQVHRAQAPVEVYQKLAADPALDILELEFHGPYRELAPGEELAIEETWRLYRYEGADEPAAQTEFLHRLGFGAAQTPAAP